MSILTAKGYRKMEGDILVKTTIINIILPIGLTGANNKVLFPSNYEIENCRRIRNIEVMCQATGGNVFYENFRLISVTSLAFMVMTLKNRKNIKIMDRQPLAVFASNINDNPIVQNNLLHTFDLPKVFTQNSYIEFVAPASQLAVTTSLPIKLYYE